MGVAVDLLTRQLGHAIEAARFAVDGLDDDELTWEPVPGSWSVEHDTTGRRRVPWDAPTPPVTTIEWRLAHLGQWTIAYHDWIFGDATMTGDDPGVPSGAIAMIAWLYDAQDRFRGATAALDDARLDVERPTQWDGLLPTWQLVWAIVAEHFHHGAEIGVLRDLRRGHARKSWWPELHDRQPLFSAESPPT
jgi:hypothetical protein